MLDMKLLPKHPLQRAIISTTNANNFITLDMDTLSTLRDNSATPRRTNWTWISSQIWEIVPQQGEDNRRVEIEKLSSNQSQGGRLYFQPMGEEILPMLDTSSLDIFMKESLVKRRNNEYQGALRWPLKLNLQQDLSLGENLPGKCLKCLVLYIPIMLPATNAIKKELSFSFNKLKK